MRCRGALCALAIVAALGGADASQAARDQKWLGKLSTKARNLRSALETAPRRDLSEHEAVPAAGRVQGAGQGAASACRTGAARL